MKKLFAIMLLLLVTLQSTYAQTAYAILSDDNTTLTFYYDSNKEEREGGIVNVNSTGGWNIHDSKNITTVVFDPTYANFTGITSTALWFSSYSNLTTINGLEYLNTANVTNMSYMFSGCSGLMSLDVSGFKTDNVTDMQMMFYGCSSLTSLDVSGFKTDNVTDMGWMFSGCSGLTSLDVSGFKTDNVTDMWAMFDRCSGLTSLDVTGFKTDNVTNMSYMFSGCSGLMSLDVSGFKTDNVTDMQMMFYGCSSLTSLDVSGFKTDNVTDMGWMFSGCSGLTSLDVSGFKTDNVTDMWAMFDRCSGLTSLDVTGFKTDNVTNMSSMFSGCSGLMSLDVTGFKTDKVTKMEAMFAYCSGLTSLDVTGFNTENVTGMGRMFDDCSGLTSLDVTGFKTDNVTRMVTMFSGCSGLTSLDVTGFKTGNVTDMDGMFSGCSGLMSLDVTGFKTDNVTSMSGMFYGCSSLTSLDLSGFKTDNVTNMSAMFYNCSSLVTIYVGDGWSTAKVVYGVDLFKLCPNLVGGAGTTYNTDHADHTYACIDGGASNPGYFTSKGGGASPTEETITVSSAGQTTWCSDKDLDFTGYPDLKAYVATGYDKASGTIWLTRVKEVPANTGFLLMGEADTYKIPVKAGGLSAYYQNMFKGTLEGTTIYTTDGNYTNYYLSDGESGVGFYKVTKEEGVTLGKNRAYLPIPTEIPVVGTAGSTETIKVSSAGQVPYYNTESLDFSSLDAQGVKAYTATGYDYNSGTIWLTRVKQVPAKTGILIMAPEGEYPVPTASISSVYANMFRGTLEGTTIQTHEEIDGKDYINYYLSSGASGVGFYRVTKEEGVKIGANRCYLPILNKDAAAGTRSANSDLNQIAFEESDEVIGIQLLRGIGGDENGTTSIKDLTPALSEGEGEWYTLQGQRVAKPGKGLYIRNGKMVIVR